MWFDEFIKPFHNTPKTDIINYIKTDSNQGYSLVAKKLQNKNF